MSKLGTVGLFVTLKNDCNLNCRFCEFPNRPEFRNGLELDYDRLVYIIKEAKKDSPIPLGAVSYCGSGEPLLYSRISELVAETKKYVPHVSIVTNGVALNEKKSRSLLEAGVDHVVVSITGISENVYEKYQGSGRKTESIQTQLQIVKNNVKRFVEIRNEMCSMSQIGISYILSEESRQEYFQALNYWNNVGVNYVDTRILSVGFPLEENDFEEDIRKNSKWWWESCCTCFGKVMNVFADGRIGFCNCSYKEETILGSIYHNTLGDILRTEKFCKLCDAFTENYSNIPEICKKCDLRRARPILA